jgi:hypothetical protein
MNFKGKKLCILLVVFLFGLDQAFRSYSLQKSAALEGAQFTGDSSQSWALA